MRTVGTKNQEPRTKNRWALTLAAVFLALPGATSCGEQARTNAGADGPVCSNKGRLSATSLSKHRKALADVRSIGKTSKMALTASDAVAPFDHRLRRCCYYLRSWSRTPAQRTARIEVARLPSHSATP